MDFESAARWTAYLASLVGDSLGTDSSWGIRIAEMRARQFFHMHQYQQALAAYKEVTGTEDAKAFLEGRTFRDKPYLVPTIARDISSVLRATRQFGTASKWLIQAAQQFERQDNASESLRTRSLLWRTSIESNANDRDTISGYLSECDDWLPRSRTNACMVFNTDSRNSEASYRRSRRKQSRRPGDLAMKSASPVIDKRGQVCRLP